MVKYLTLPNKNNYISIFCSPNLLKQSTDERDINIPKYIIIARTYWFCKCAVLF